MRIFEHRNTSNPEDVCPICKTNEDGQTVLVPIIGTEDGNLMQAKQFHFKCIDIVYMQENDLLYQKL